MLIAKDLKDRAKYAEKYAQEMQKYMDKMLEHYNSVISSITTLLDRKISSANKGKDAAIKALQEEQAAAEEAYQAQIDAIQEEIDALDDLIDAKNDEIDKLNDQIDVINEANAARDRSINLQKAEYELQRQMNQRTKLVYTGEQGQMRYERDEQGVRDAQENLKDAQDDIAIAAIEKQIKLIEDEIKALEKEKEALSKQQEELQKMMEASSKYYEKLIAEQEKYWDSIIEALENTKSKWEELAEVDSVAKAWGLVEDEMKRFGYTVDDVLNDVPGAFEKFKGEYIKILEQMHSGDQGYLDGLKNTVGQVPGEYQKIATAASETEAPIQKLGDSAGTAAGKVSSFGSSAGTAATSVKNLKDASEGISENLDGLNDVNTEGLNTQLNDLETKVTDLKNLINGDDSIKSAFEELNSINVDGLITSFDGLVSSIGSVIGLLTGSGDEEGTFGGAGRSGKNGMPSNIPASATSTSGGSSLTNAIASVKESAIQNIGGNEEEEGDTAIGAFVALKKAVDNVTTAIGMGEEGEEASAGPIGNVSDGGTLTAAITSIQETSTNSLRGSDGAEGVIPMFEEFRDLLNQILEIANDLIDKLRELSTIELPDFSGLSMPSFSVFSFNRKATGTAIPKKYQHYEGTAKLTGDWGVRGNETALTGELGQEVVIRNGRFFTVGDNGPEFVRLKKGDVVLNHLQAAELLSKKNLVLPKKGPAHVDGTLPSGFFPLNEDSSLEKIRARIKEMGLPTIDGIKAALQAQTDAIRSEVRNVVANTSNTNTTVNQNNTFNISGVSGEDVARQINNTLVNTFSGMSLNAYQRSMA